MAAFGGAAQRFHVTEDHLTVIHQRKALPDQPAQGAVPAGQRQDLHLPERGVLPGAVAYNSMLS